MFSRYKDDARWARVQVHKWYRVVNPGEDPIYNGTLWTRDVTVVGPDWDWNRQGIPAPPGHDCPRRRASAGTNDSTGNIVHVDELIQ